MRFRYSPLDFASQFQADVRTLTCGRLRGGPSLSDRAVALDRIAGSTLLAGVAAAGFWLVAQTLPLSQLQLPAVADSAHAAAAAAPSLDLQRLSAEAAAEPLSPGDIRQLQSRLQRMGFNPGVVDGIVGGRTLDALNRYRATKDLARVWQVDRGAAADLLN